MKTIKKLQLATAIAAGLTLAGCGSDSDSASTPSITKVFDCTDVSTQGARVICIGSADDLSDAAVQKELIDELAQAQTGDTFVFPQGRFNITTTIGFQGINEDSQTVSDLTFKGAGMDLTIFDASGSTADGFKIEDTDNITFEDFGVYESNNNAIKVIGSDGVIMRRVATVWETDYLPTNGAYGLYPVESSNILIEDSFVQGSADAGVYVGQSNNIVVRNNIALKNVAGIEIENSTNADVYGNTARGNTGGILVFDLPIGNGKYGSDVRVFDNIVDANNADNFAAGCTDAQVEADTCFEGGVHIVPPGTGMIILSTSNVEIFNNTITDHKTDSISITSYLMADAGVAAVPNSDVGGADGDDSTTAVLTYDDISKFGAKYLDGWSPFVNGINMHDNTLSVADGINAPEGKLIQAIIDGYQFLQDELDIIPDGGNAKLPSILYDGVGEMLAVTPNPGGEGESIMHAIAVGTNMVAGGLNQFDLEATLKQISDLTPFTGQLYATGEGRVCQSNNGVDGTTITAASVFHTAPNADSFTAEGELMSKVEIAGMKAEAGDDLGVIAEAIALLSDDSMTCSDSAYIGEVATVTVGNETFGCGQDDDTTSPDFCGPQ